MKKIVWVISLLLGTHMVAFPQSEIERVLLEVEKNNAGLEALRMLRDAQSLEARTGNSLENPEVEFGHLWGRRGDQGKNGELTVTQSVDLPMVYVHRNKLARLQAERYGHEYMAERQQTLLEAQTLCIQILGMRQTVMLQQMLVDNAQSVLGLFERRESTGDANIMEVNDARFVLVGLRSELRMTQAELAAAEQRLANLNGGNPITVTDTSALQKAPGLPPYAEMMERYRTASPRVLAMLTQRAEAERDVKLSRSQSLPKLAVGYKYEFSPGEKFDGVVVGMSIPMFGNRNNVKRARAQAMYTDAQYRSGILDLEADLKERYARYGILEQTVASYRELVDPLGSMDILRKALEAGQISLVEYFVQIQPVNETRRIMCDVMRDLHLLAAEINMIDL